MKRMRRRAQSERTPARRPRGAPRNTGTASAAASSADAQQAMAAADRNPKDYAAQMKAAAVFYQADDYDKAQLYLQRALAIKPKDMDALTAMGNAKYDKGDFAGAAEFYQRVLAITPKD